LSSQACSAAPKVLYYYCFYQVRQGRTWSRNYKSQNFDLCTPNFQNYTQFSKLYSIFKIILNCQNFTQFSKLYSIFQNSDQFLKLYTIFKTILITLYFQFISNISYRVSVFFLHFCTFITIFFSILAYPFSSPFHLNCCSWSPNYSVLGLFMFFLWSTGVSPRFCVYIKSD
jgi:hypothetical protein